MLTVTFGGHAIGNGSHAGGSGGMLPLKSVFLQFTQLNYALKAFKSYTLWGGGAQIFQGGGGGKLPTRPPPERNSASWVRHNWTSITLIMSCCKSFICNDEESVWEPETDYFH